MHFYISGCFHQTRVKLKLFPKATPSPKLQEALAEARKSLAREDRFLRWWTHLLQLQTASNHGHIGKTSQDRSIQVFFLVNIFFIFFSFTTSISCTSCIHQEWRDQVRKRLQDAMQSLDPQQNGQRRFFHGSVAVVPP